jgi:hypothetical protein
MKYEELIYLIQESDQSDLLLQVVNGKDTDDEDENDVKDDSDIEDNENDVESSDIEDNENDVEDGDTEDDEEIDDKDNEIVRKNKEKKKITKQYEDKIDTISSQIVTDINIKLQDKGKEILNNIKFYGIIETIQKYIEKYFVPYIKDTEDKLFITINIDEIAIKVDEKLSKKLLIYKD